MMPGLGHAIRLSRSHEDEAEVGGERRVVSVDGVKRKIVSGRQFENFRTCGFQLTHQCLMLRLRDLKVWSVMESQVAATRRRAAALVPSCGAR